MPDPIVQESQAILATLALTEFNNCIPLSKEFRQIPMTAGIYAVKHRSLGILYIGKRDRFRGGHKALLWAFYRGTSAQRCQNHLLRLRI